MMKPKMVGAFVKVELWNSDEETPEYALLNPRYIVSATSLGDDVCDVNMTISTAEVYEQVGVGGTAMFRICGSIDDLAKVL
jgi:hypothetical protein